MARRDSGPITGLFIGGVMLFGGYFMTYYLGKPIRDQAAASTTWPTTDGRITGSEIQRVNARDEGKATYTANITYEYSLGGRTFEGDRVWFGDDYSASNASAFRAAVSRYPVGKAVKVHYDPADAAESVLEPGPTWSGSALYFIGLGLMTIGGIITLSAAGQLLLVSLSLAAAVSGALERRRNPNEDFSPGRDDPARDFERPAPQPLQGGTTGELPDDDGIEIV